MSTKQIVITTMMMLFGVVMLVCLGAWFHSSCELDAKNKAIEALKQKQGALEYLVEGSEVKPGLRQVVENPVDGLQVQLKAAADAAVAAEGDTQSGMKQRQALYEEKEPEIVKKWKTDAVPHWKNTYDEWLKLNKDIADAAERSKKVIAESEEKVSAAQTDLDQALNDETTERSKTVVERKKMTDEIGQIRFNQEEVLAKINEVTREVRKQRLVVPQGKVIHSAPELLTATIDMGSVQGIRKGLHFDVYSSAHAGQVYKATLEVAQVGPASSDCVVLPPKKEDRVDPVTGWVPTDPKMRYSPLAGSGPDETDATELVKPKSKADRVEQLRIEKIEREEGLEAAEKARHELEAPSKPPSELGLGFYPIAVGDWICNPDFTPIIPNAAFQDQTREELLAMRDINTGPLTFYFSDAVRTYRREFLKRVCERNGCKTAELVTADVNYIVSTPGTLRIDLLEEKLAPSKDKGDDAITPEIRSQRKVLAALQDGKKIGAQTIADDELEAFFDRRQRKMELLRGKAIQPGQHTFYIAGQTRDRSVDQLTHWIKDHGGVMVPDLDSKVDYVVVAGTMDQAFIDKVRKLGLKIIREDELPTFFGVQ